MIRGHKEGSTYATWFIGFDHDDTFGLSPFPELPPQSPRTPVHSKPVSRATSLESLLPASHSRDLQSLTLTPAATQTSTQTTEETPTRATRQAFTQVTEETPTKTTRQAFTQSTEETPTKTTRQAFTQATGEPTTRTTSRTSTQAAEESFIRTTGQNITKVTNLISKDADTETLDLVATPGSCTQHEETRLKSQDIDSNRSRKRWAKETQDLYKEAFDGAKRAEEFKFRVKFDKLVGDLHVALAEKGSNGLTTNIASPSYGEVMLTFKEKVKELLKGFSQRLQLAYESLGPADSPENTGQKVKQSVSKFIEDLIGETLDLTSDEAVSDLSSLSDESNLDQNSYEDLIAQAVVSKLLENVCRELNETISSSNKVTKKTDLKDQGTETQDKVFMKNQRDGFTSYDFSERSQNGVADVVDGFQKLNSEHFNCSHSDAENGSTLSNSNFFHPGSDDTENKNVNYHLGIKINGKSDRTKDHIDLRTNETHSVSTDSSNSLNSDKSHSVNSDKSQRLNSDALHFINSDDSHSLNSDKPHSFNSKKSHSLTSEKSDSFGSEKSHSLNSEKSHSLHSDKSNYLNKSAKFNPISGLEVENGIPGEETDIVREFELLKEFVKKTQISWRPKVEAIPFDDSLLCEVKEDTLIKKKIDHDEERDDFYTRYSVFDRVHNSQPVLPDFSQFENIVFGSDEIDPDLLSMNLAIIPEETEEELVQEEEDDKHGRWKANWLFKNNEVSPYENMGKKAIHLNSEDSLYMTIPKPAGKYSPQIGNRDIDQLSDFSDHDLLGHSDLDGSDDEENTFYANTSKELARISGQRKWSGGSQRLHSSGSRSDNSDREGKAQKQNNRFYDSSILDFDDVDSHTSHISGPIVEPNKLDLELLHYLIPAENDDPKFLSTPESVVIQEGEPVKFSCRVAGTAPIDVFWYREGDEIEELEESEDVEISSSGDKHSIILYNIGKKMAGQYMCIATNEKGKATQYLVVTVKDNKQELKKPEFLKGLKDVEVTEGQSVKFRVKVKGYPSPRISWYKDGELLKSSRTCRLEKFGNRDYILTLDYASMNDDAEYTVSARNVAGEQKMSAQVIVEPQSDLPVRRQRISSNTTSGASDSDSDRSTPRRPHTSVSSTIPGALTSTTSRRSQKEDQLHINYLDKKIALTQKQLVDETMKMQNASERDDLSGSNRLMTPDTLDVLQVAEEIIQRERSRAEHSPSKEVNEFKLPPSQDVTNVAVAASPLSTSAVINPESLIDALPDTLDEFIMPDLQTKSVQADLKLTFSGRRESDTFKSEVTSGFPVGASIMTNDTATLSPPSVSLHAGAHNQNNTNTDDGIGIDMSDNSLSAHKSSISDSDAMAIEQLDIAADISRKQALKEQYSRDYEISHGTGTEKRRWSVTIDPFSSQVEVVNRQNGAEKMSNIEISVTELSPASSVRSSKGDNSSQSSSRRQSTDSGVCVSTRQKRPPQVHMVGHTTEDEVPESRTEFNTDGSIELPSVNRLRAMFSSTQDEDLGNGSFRRIHSITARNVPVEQLEKLRTSHHNESASSSSGKFLEVPGSSSASAHLSSTTFHQNSPSTQSATSSSNVTLKSVPLADSIQTHEKQKFQFLETGAYRGLDPDKDPVLIYPETDPDYMQRHHSQHQQQSSGVASLVKPVRAFHPQKQPVSQVSPSSMTKMAASRPPQSSQQKLLLRRASDDNDSFRKSGPRIKSGCISARAAFWERKIIDGGSADNFEFPEMVVDGDM